MAYICKDCENKTRFYRQTTYRFDREDRVGYSENNDTEDTDYGDEYDEQIISEGDLTCYECEGVNIEDVDDDDWEAWVGPGTEPPLPKEKLSAETWKTYLTRRK